MNQYFDERHAGEIQALQRTFTARTDWPTWLLLIATYVAWVGLLLGSPELGRWPSIVLLVPLVTFWMSLQHELLHGHPTRWPWINKLLGYAPFAVWYPYTLYRDSHLAHHRDESLTVPSLDPESRYLDQAGWRRSSRFGRGLHWFGKTLLGRLSFGAPLAVAALVRGEALRLAGGDRQAWAMWLTHGACTVAMLLFVEHYSVLSAWDYLMLVSLPALSLAMLRSFYEHRPAEHPEQRSVLNEAGWPLNWLFLHLNLHLVHHDLPGLPWYYLPRVYRARRQQWIERSGGFLVDGYAGLLRRHALRPVDSPRHPFA